MQLTEHASHAAADETLLRDNLVLTIEPSLSYGNGLMIVHDEDIVVTDGAPRLLTIRADPNCRSSFSSLRKLSGLCWNEALKSFSGHGANISTVFWLITKCVGGAPERWTWRSFPRH